MGFLCSRDGTIRRVVTDALEGAALGPLLCESVDAASADACRLFLRAVTRGGFARSTPLRLGSRDVHCFGYCRDDEATVVAVIDPSSAASFADAVAAAGAEGFAALAAEIRRTHSAYEVYEELARLNNELVTTQRELARTVGELKRLNAFKDELLGIAAHDLRNPLNANSAFITFMLQDTAGMSENNLLLLRRLRGNSDYMLRLVEDVLDFSAIQSGNVRLHLAPASVAAIAGSVVETMRIVAARKEIEIRFDPGPPLPAMSLDEVKITQAVQNLVANAVQYSPIGSTVDVRVTADQESVTIAVEDRGPGISPQEQGSLFKPFTRLSTRPTGKERSVGLGLAITSRLVEAHGGTIDVRSEVGKGSTFTVRLKRSAP